MAILSEAQINDLAARTTIESGLVTIPGAENLTLGEMNEIYKRALELQAPVPLDIDTLFRKLRDITPPIDEDELDAEFRRLDAEARQDLINDGCPPCYPPHLEVPMRNPPPEYHSIVRYWQSGMVRAVLCAQRSDWHEFRRYQTRERARYGERKFHMYVERATETRRRLGMAGDVRFLFKKELQSQLETWTEFQHYHLIAHEELERDREKAEQKWDEFVSRQRQEGVTPSTDGPPEYSREWALAFILKDRTGFVERHNNLLEWTEQQRLAMKAAEVSKTSPMTTSGSIPVRIRSESDIVVGETGSEEVA